MNEHKELKLEDIKKIADAKKCHVQKALYLVTEFLSGPMCGRCFPCSMGSYEAKIRLEDIAGGKGTKADIAKLKMIAGHMLETSMCKKGKDTAKFIIEWIDSGVFEEHIKGTCAERECTSLIEYVIIPEKCIMCGLCQDVCKYHAILGKKKKPYQSGHLPFDIRQKRCIKCGDCIKVCPTEAIVIIDIKQVAAKVEV